MKKLPAQEKIFLYKYFYQALRGKIPLKQALSAYIEDIHPARQKIFLKLQEGLNKNKSFWKSLINSRAFSDAEIFVFKNLEENRKNYQAEKFWLEPKNYRTFKELYIFLQNELNLRKKFIGIFAYPAVLIFMLISFLSITVFWFLPKIEPIISKLHIKPPFLLFNLINLEKITQQIINKNLLPYLFLVVSFFWLLKQIFQIRAIKKVASFLYLQIPVLNRLLKIRYFLDISFYLFLLTKNSDLIKALSHLKPAIKNVYIQDVFQKVKANIEKGGRISDVWKSKKVLTKKNNYFTTERKIFPAIFRRLIEIGEKTNSLSNDFYYCYQILQEEVETEIKLTISYLEPIFILFIASILGFLALSISSIFTQMYSKMF